MKTKIAVTSGKGGAGKTTVALSLFLANLERSELMDCDVEEPNCHLFLDSELQKIEQIQIPIPKIDTALCTSCGRCVEVCQFNALIKTRKNKIAVFEELCHSCGACLLACRPKAISEDLHGVGEIIHYNASDQNHRLLTGKLAVGQSAAPEIIRKLMKVPQEQAYQIIDAAPGVSCTLVRAIEAVDYVLAVAEATPFGLSDFKLLVKVLDDMKKPFGVIINKAPRVENILSEYCKDNSYEVLLTIQESRTFAEAYSQGRNLIEVFPHLKNDFRKILEQVNECSIV